MLQCVLLLARVTSWRLALGLALMAVSGVAEGTSLVILLPLLRLIGPDVFTRTSTRFVQLSGNLLAAIGVAHSLGAVLLLFVGVSALCALTGRWQAMVNAVVLTRFTSYLRLRLYRTITDMRWAVFARGRPSEFAHALTFETNLVGELTSQLLFLLGNAMIAAVHVMVSMQLSVSLTAVVLLCGGALFLVSQRRAATAHALGNEYLTAARTLSSTMVDHLHALKTAKTYDAVEANFAAAARLSATVSDLANRMARTQAASGASFQIGWVMLLGVIVYVAVRVVAVPAAELLLLLFVFARLMPKFSVIQQTYQKCLRLGPAFAHLTELEARYGAAAEPSIERRAPVSLRSAIDLDGITVRHAADEPPALSGLDLAIRRGETTAIVGPSGAGKSTIADLLIGLVTPEAGQVRVDGTPLAPEQLPAWRAQIGLVPQDCYLLNDTVQTNLLWACPDAADGDIKRALAAAAADFVFDLPDGLDTLLGERGVRLSGGERQRLVLACALLRRPSLLILDEATSAVDSENEQRIQQAIETLHGRMTIVVIAHRLTTVRAADVIHVVEHGRVVESGPWDVLIARPDGRFRALCRAQGLVEDG